uniref:Polymerase (DNA-directed), delta interacting protein 3 n=1 Tax=Cyprinus carpio TaxID=7962 RepID=A0A8C2CDV8_CYPCA
MIGSGDVRQRLGVGGATGGKRPELGASCGLLFQVKDAREKLGQKDARLRIQGRGGGAGAVQDARQLINSRKQQQTPPPSATPVRPAGIPHVQIHNTGPLSAGPRPLSARMGVALQPGGGITTVVDARDRLSLKRSVPTASNQSAAFLKITKTIQQRPVGVTSGVRVSVPSGAAPVMSAAPEEDDGAVIPNKQMKITTANNLQTRTHRHTHTHTPPHTHTHTHTCTGTHTHSPMHRYTHTHTPAQVHTLTPPVFSPLEGTKITVNNLHPRVTEEDIVELFCVCGALKRARLVKAGVAEVVFVRKEDAVSAYRKYNNRCLDGQPMKCNLHMQGSVITSEQPILLRLSDSPSAAAPAQKHSSSRSGSKTSSGPEVDPQTILKALFKSSGQSGSSGAETSGPHSTAFRIKI